MAGSLVISTLNNDTGPLATQNGMTGIAKAWVRFGGGTTYTAGAIQGSFNVSSVTVNSTANFTINYTTAMADANYAIIGIGNIDSGNSGYNGIVGPMTTNGAAPVSITTSSVRVQSVVSSGAAQAPVLLSVAIFD